MERKRPKRPQAGRSRRKLYDVMLKFASTTRCGEQLDEIARILNKPKSEVLRELAEPLIEQKHQQLTAA